jgi:uncharacterized protein YlxW (UPF0749 family)
MSAPETVENTMSRDDYMRLLRERNNFAAERDALAARVERLEEALETMQRSRDRYREEWERARGREEAAARAAPSTDARGPDSAPPTA